MTYTYTLDGKDIHFTSCQCGLCNNNGHSYGVVVFDGNEQLDVVYGPSEEAALHNAKIEYDDITIACHSNWVKSIIQLGQRGIQDEWFDSLQFDILHVRAMTQYIIQLRKKS